MRVALAIWGSRISPVFDVSRHLLILETEDGKVLDRREQWLPDDSPGKKVRILCDMEVDTLICGAVSDPLAAMVESAGMRLIAFVTGDIESVMAEFLSENLPNDEMVMPGCCSGPRRHPHRRGRMRRSSRRKIDRNSSAKGRR